jgi:hypothetical protein
MSDFEETLSDLYYEWINGILDDMNADKSVTIEEQIRTLYQKHCAKLKNEPVTKEWIASLQNITMLFLLHNDDTIAHRDRLEGLYCDWVVSDRRKTNPPDLYLQLLRQKKGFIRGRMEAEDRTGTQNVIRD